jgi:hypothetical protein
MSASLKLTSELLDEMKSEWVISSSEGWKGVHRETGKVIEAENASKLATKLSSWVRDLYMAMC